MDERPTRRRGPIGLLLAYGKVNPMWAMPLILLIGFALAAIVSLIALSK